MSWGWTDGIATGREDFIARVETFLLARGWTLHDNQMGASPPYKVWHSTGEDGKRGHFLQLRVSATADRSVFRVFRHWNNATQVGQSQIPSAALPDSLFQTPNAGFPYWLYGDKDSLYTVTRQGSSYYLQVVANAQPFFSAAVATTTGAISAGAGVTIPVDTVAPFQVGKTYQLCNFNAATGAGELVTVTAVGASDVTVASVANAHPSGALLGEMVARFVLAPHSSSTFWGGNTACWTATTTHASPSHASVSVHASGGPDGWQGYRWLIPVIAHLPSSPTIIFGTLPNFYTVRSAGLGSEDTITVNGVVYKYFFPTGATLSNGCAIRQG